MWETQDLAEELAKWSLTQQMQHVHPAPATEQQVGGVGTRAFTASSPKIPAPWLTLDNQEELGQRQGVHVSVPQARYQSIHSEGQQETPPVVVGAEPQEITPPPQHRPPTCHHYQTSKN